MTQVAAALVLQGVRKHYGRVTAVDDVSLDVGQGECLALLGPSGCGKSTLLRLIAGLETPDAGSIDAGARRLSDVRIHVPPEDRHISLVFQDHALFPHLTVQQNVEFGLNRQSGADKKARVRQVLEMVRLDGVHGRYPHELSGGQQQRVALARALAPDPLLVLLDEPFSDLDRSLRCTLREDVREVLKTNGTPAIFVTHDQEEALVVGDRVAVQRAGRVEQVAEPEVLFSHPASRFIAEFVGEAEFLAGEVTADGVETEIGLVTPSEALPLGATVDVAIRADDVSFDPDPEGRCTVVSHAFNGMTNTYRLRLPSGDFVHSLQRHTLRLDQGTPVNVRAEPGHPLACFRPQTDSDDP